MLMFRSKITRRLVTSFLLIIFASFALLGAFLLHYFHDYTLENERTALIRNAKIIEVALEPTFYVRSDALDDTLERLHNETGLRITVMDAEGNVLGDTAQAADRLDNHFAREEVQAALTSDYGVAVRESATLHENLMYVAVPIRYDGQLTGIIRTANSLSPMEHSYHTIFQVIIWGLFLALSVSFLISVWLAHRQVRPIMLLSQDAMAIAAGNLDKRLRWHSGDEFDTLVQTINHLTENLAKKIQESQAEAHKLALTLDNIDNAIMLIDARGNIVDANPQAEAIFHLSPGCLQRHSIHVIGNAQLSETAQVVSRENRSQTITFHTDRDDGEHYTFQVFLAPFPEEDDQKLVLAVFHDISMLQEINDRQAEFVSNAAHELATPLTSISGFAETLLDDDFKDPDASHHFAGIIYREAQRMSRLMKSLLQLARLSDETCRKQLVQVPVDLAAVARQEGQALLDTAEAKNQQLIIEGTEAPLFMLATPELCGQIVHNLIENAIKYTPEGGTITVRAAGTDASVNLCVEDNGIGIAAADLPRIFDRFYRVDKARARKSGGNGIGLSLVKFLVELFGGQIKAESEVGRGTRFTLTFPRCRQ